MIECAWDATHQIVLLHRSPAPEGPAGDLRLALSYGGGAEQYFAGVFPAAWPLWAVQAPASGDFRLAFYPAEGGGDAFSAEPEPLQELVFERGLVLRAEQRVPRGHRLCGRLFGPRNEGTRVGMAAKQVLVEPGRSLQDWLTEQRLHPPLKFGISVTACGEGVQGPACHPYRADVAGIPVCIARLPDTEPLPGDAVQLRGFDAYRRGEPSDRFDGLSFPAIDVDLTAFGPAAQKVRPALTFFHRPFLGGARGEAVRRFSGADLPLRNRDGRLYVRWGCPDGCHRDLLGVHLASGHQLVARTNSEDVNCLLREAVDPDACVAVIYLGDRCLPYSPPEEVLVQEQGMSETLAEVELARFASWAAADERLRSQEALSGAEQAEACTLFAYVELLGELEEVIRAEDGHDSVSPLLRRLGLGLRSFAEFARRPDLAFALVGLEGLRSCLAAAGTRLRAPEQGAGMSLIAYLASALEGGDPELAGWVDAHATAQPLLWRLLLAGVAPGRLRAAGLEPDGGVAEPAYLAANLELCLDQDARALAAALLADLGQDPAPLTQAPQRLSDVEPLSRLLSRAELGLADDLARVGMLLGEAHLPAPAGVGAVKESFGRALEAGTVPPRGALIQRVARAAASQGLPGAGRIGREVRTGAALQALLDILEGRAPVTPDCAGLVLAWCKRVLEGGEPAWVDAAPLTTGEQEEVLDALKNREATWFLPNGSPRWPWPTWAGSREVRQRAKEDDLAAGIAAARAWLRALPGGGGAQCQAQSALIERLERLGPWLVARRIWDDAIQPAMDGAVPPELRERAGKANRYTGDWETVASDIDAALGRA